jgi:hypothetical protein
LKIKADTIQLLKI